MDDVGAELAGFLIFAMIAVHGLVVLRATWLRARNGTSKTADDGSIDKR